MGGHARRLGTGRVHRGLRARGRRVRAWIGQAVAERGADGHRVRGVEDDLDIGPLRPRHGEAVLDALEPRARHVEHPPLRIALELARTTDDAVALEDHPGHPRVGQVQPEPDVVVGLGGTVRTARSSAPCGPCARARPWFPTTEKSSRRWVDPVTVLAARRAHEVEQAREGVLHVAAQQVEVGDGDRGADVGGVRGGRGACRGEVDAGGALHESHLSEAELGVDVLGVLGEGLLVGGGRRAEVTALDGVEGLLVQRGQLVLLGTPGTSAELDPPVMPFWTAAWSSWSRTVRTS